MPNTGSAVACVFQPERELLRSSSHQEVFHGLWSIAATVTLPRKRMIPWLLAMAMKYEPPSSVCGCTLQHCNPSAAAYRTTGRAEGATLPLLRREQTCIRILLQNHLICFHHWRSSVLCTACQLRCCLNNPTIITCLQPLTRRRVSGQAHRVSQQGLSHFGLRIMHYNTRRSA